MSWVENINEKMIIVTGDGKAYFPLWLNASKAREYNVSEFDFPNIPGTLVDRRQPRGMKYNLEIYFQGADFLTDLEEFQTSADDPRAWTISHPLYGDFTCQPISLQIDLSKYNTAQVTGTIMETITEDNPKSTVVAKDKIAEDKTILDLSSADSFELTFMSSPESKISSMAYLTEMMAKNYQTAKSISPPDEQSEEYFNLYNKANAAIAQLTDYPLDAIQAVQRFINAPSLFEASARSRVDMLAVQLGDLNDSISTITGINKKKSFEAQGSAILSSMLVAASNPQTGNITNRAQVLYLIDLIYYWYNLYITLLDSLQSTNGGTTTSYIPDHDTINNLGDLVDFTISNLIIMSLGAKQERVLYLEEDSNIILLAHRFYGLKEDDSTIEDFMENNSIGLNEMLIIKKGRKILYYI